MGVFTRREKLCFHKLTKMEWWMAVWLSLYTSFLNKSYPWDLIFSNNLKSSGWQ